MALKGGPVGDGEAEAQPGYASGEDRLLFVVEIEARLVDQRSNLPAKSELGKAITDSLKRRPAVTCFLDDGRICCLANNAAELALRGVSVGRSTGRSPAPISDRGGERAAGA